MAPFHHGDNMTEKTAEQAILEAQARGEDISEPKDSDGQPIMQRPISLDDPPTPKRRGPGRPRKGTTRARSASTQKEPDRVKIYHRRNCKMFLTDCTVGPRAEAMVLRSDYEHPNVKPHCLLLA